MPKTDTLTAKIEEITRMVEEMGGRPNLFVATHFAESQEQRAIAEFQASRQRECAEIINECHKALQHIARENREQQFTFEEVEELEGDLDKISRWFSEVRGRDFWGAPAIKEVEKAIAEVELALADFVQKTYDRLR